MSLRSRLQDVIDQDPPTNAYSNQLKKDISRVEQFSRDCDRILPTLNDSKSIDKQIIALYDTYGRIPYIHDKNDTIDTAATSVILHELIERYKTTSSSNLDFSAFVTQLQSNNREKELMIQTLRDRFSIFESPLDSKSQEARELEVLLESFLEIIATVEDDIVGLHFSGVFNG